jgi:hypothetical protein
MSTAVARGTLTSANSTYSGFAVGSPHAPGRQWCADAGEANVDAPASAQARTSRRRTARRM